jgi:hypothetical protein
VLSTESPLLTRNFPVTGKINRERKMGYSKRVKIIKYSGHTLKIKKKEQGISVSKTGKLIRISSQFLVQN